MKLPSSPFLYPIFDSSYSDDLKSDALEAIRAGVQILQIRAKRISKGMLWDMVQELEPHCRDAGVSLIVNDYVDVALCSNFAGVHLGQDDFPVADARRLLKGRIIGFSTHNTAQFEKAIQQQSDYIAIGPIYTSPTKPGANPELGSEFVQMARSRTTKPLVAIGGIREENFGKLIAAGIDGIALISEIYKGRSIYDQIRKLQDAISTETRRARK